MFNIRGKAVGIMLKSCFEGSNFYPGLGTGKISSTQASIFLRTFCTRFCSRFYADFYRNFSLLARQLCPVSTAPIIIMIIK